MTTAASDAEWGAFAGFRREVQARLDAAELGETVDSGNSVAAWPVLEPAAFHGIAGDFVRMVEPATEADPAALLVQFLAAAGCSIGGAPCYRVEADRHAGNLFVVVVGDTASGRKGTSQGHVRRVFTEADPALRVRGGLSSGEGLAYEVRDPVYRLEFDKKTKTTEEVLVDPGEDDKRLLVVEAEFASVLKVATRQGNTIATMLRDAWDGRTLAPMTKNNRVTATDPHVAVVGHVTRSELLRHLGETDAASGFANRFLWVLSRRSKVLPRGGHVDHGELIRFCGRLRAALDVARRLGELDRTEETWQAWEQVYEPLTAGRGGLLGAMLARGAAHVTRLSLLYAMLDGDDLIRPEHHAAALAVWRYAEQSASLIFGDLLGDPVADAILDALRTAGAAGLTRTEIRDLGGRHWSRQDVDRALAALQAAGLADVTKEATGGRPVERWTARDRSDRSDERGRA